MRKIRYWLLIAFMFVGYTSCIDDSIPQEIIPQEQMKVLLKEFHLANALAQRVGKSVEEKEANRQELFSAILKQEGETRENFQKSYLFYLDNPKYLDAIYKQIVEEFNQEVSIEEDFRYNIMRDRKDAYVNEIKPELTDSLKKLKPVQKPGSQK